MVATEGDDGDEVVVVAMRSLPVGHRSNPIYVASD